jgi:hypothetical protein
MGCVDCPKVEDVLEDDPCDRPTPFVQCSEAGWIWAKDRASLPRCQDGGCPQRLSAIRLAADADNPFLPM